MVSNLICGTKQRLILVAAALSLGACQQNAEIKVVPASLVPITASIDVDRVWTAKVGKSSEEVLNGLIVTGNGVDVFAASTDGRVIALDAITGQRKWQANLGSARELSGGPGIGGDLVVIGTQNAEVIALSAETGEQRWTARVSSSVISTPAVNAASVVVRTGDGNLTAFDAVDGEERWNVSRPIQGFLTLRGASSPVFASNAVLAGFDNGKVAAIDTKSGALLWERAVTERRGSNEFERLADVDGKITLSGEEAYIVGFQGRAMVITIPTGQPRWATDMSSRNNVALDWNQVFISTSDDKVVALERSTGVQTWRQSQLDNRKLSAPAALGSSVVVGDFEGYLHWISAIDGSFQARVRADSSAITSPPLVMGEMLYVLTDAGELHAYKASAL